MAIEVELPDGTIVEFPDNTPNSVMESALKQYKPKVQKRASPQELQARMNAGDPEAKAEWDARMAASMTPDSAAPYSAVNPNAYASTSGSNGGPLGIGGDSNFLAAVGGTVGDTGNGLLQSLIEGSPTRQIAEGAFNMAGLKVPLSPVEQKARAWIERRIADKRATDKPMSEARGGTLGNIAGNVLQMGIIPTRLMPNTYKGNAALGGLIGSIQPRTEGEIQLANTAGGTAGGIGGQFVANRLSSLATGGSDKLGKLKTELYQKAKELNIPVTAAQLSDSRFVKWLQSVSKDVPFTGAASINKQQVDSYTKAAANRFGVKTDELTPRVLDAIDLATSKMYDKALQGTKIRIDKQANQDFQNLRNTPGTLKKDEWKLFDELANSVKAELKNGSLDGRIYQTLRQNMRDAEASGGNYGDMVKKLRTIFEKNTERNISPERAALFREANARYRDKKLIDKAMNRADTMDVRTATEGKLNPTSLRALGNTKYGISPGMDDLARIGQMIKDPAPNSGTPMRQGIMGSAIAGGNFAAAFDPMALAMTGTALAGARALNSKWLGRYMGEGLGPRAVAASEVGGTLAKLASPMAAKQASPSLQGMIRRDDDIKQAAIENPDRGPEILSNLSPENDPQTAQEFSQATGFDVNQVLKQIQDARMRNQELWEKAPMEDQLKRRQLLESRN